MANKISRVFFVVFLVYYAWYQQAIGYIPRLSTLLLLGLVVFSVTDILINKYNYRSLITGEMVVWAAFIIYALLAGMLLAADKDLVITAVKMMSKYLLIWIYMIYISKRDNDNHFIICSLYIMTWFQIVSALIRPYYIANRLTLGAGNNANDYANFLLIGLIVTIILSVRSNNRFFHLINIILTFEIVYQIIMTASRQGFIGMIFVLIGSIFISIDKQTIARRFRNHKQALVIAFVVVVVSFLVSYFMDQSFVYKRLIASFLSGQFSGRDKLFYESIKVFMDNPIFGVGLDNFRVYSTIKQYSHITWMELLSTTGLVGFSIYLVFFIMIGKFSWNSFIQNRTVKTKRDKYLNGSAFLVFLTVFILSFVTIHFYQMSSTLLIGIILSQKYAKLQAHWVRS